MERRDSKLRGNDCTVVNRPWESPCSATWLLGHFFQKPSPSVEIQLPFIGFHPESQVTRDQRITCTPLVLVPCFYRYRFEENYREELETFIFLVNPFDIMSHIYNQENAPLRLAFPLVLKKKTLANPHSYFLFTLS